MIYIFAFCIILTFVLPGLVATRTIKADVVEFVFAIFFYAMSWSVVVEMLYMSAAQLYGFSRTSTGWFYTFDRPVTEKEKRIWRLASIPLCLTAYASTIYGFAVAYVYLSRINPKAFNIGELDMFSGIYFSVVTAATVGYGDILPLSTGARSLVMTEIVISLIFVIFFFSIMSGALRGIPPSE